MTEEQKEHDEEKPEEKEEKPYEIPVQMKAKLNIDTYYQRISFRNPLFLDVISDIIHYATPVQKRTLRDVQRRCMNRATKTQSLQIKSILQKILPQLELMVEERTVGQDFVNTISNALKEIIEFEKAWQKTKDDLQKEKEVGNVRIVEKF